MLIVKTALQGAAVFTFAFVFQVVALPQSPLIHSGEASFVSNSTQIEAQVSNGSIINWESFCIDINETVHFQLQNDTGAVLNRVLGDVSSFINGKLTSNGQVILVNPNGILFGESAQVDTNGLIASTLHVFEKSYLEENFWVFSGDSAHSVRNEGFIFSRGPVVLSGYEIQNTGVIHAPGQNVSLLACQATALSKNGRVLEKVRVGLNEKVYKELLTQTDNQFSQLFNNEADPFDASHVFIQGKIDTSAESIGGAIQVFGDWIEVQEGSILDARGESGGGNLKIGGEYKGDASNFLASRSVHIAKNSKLYTSAIENGNAGGLVIWSDGFAEFLGEAECRGGKSGGNGAFVEVSGKKFLSYEGLCDLRADFGEAGTLLLDPTDITISNAATAGGAFLGVAPNFSFEGPGPAATLNNVALQNQLVLGNVIVDATAGAGGNGDITVTGATVIWNSAFSLHLRSGNNINIRRLIQCNGSGGVTLESVGGAGSAILIQPEIAADAGIAARTGPLRVIAPNSSLSLFPAVAFLAEAKIGVDPTGNFMVDPTITAPIEIECAYLHMVCPPDIPGAFIGHVQQIDNQIRNIDAPITIHTRSVDAMGRAIYMVGSRIGVASCRIGHGNRGAQATPIGSLAGDINIACDLGDLVMESATVGAPGTNAFEPVIGHTTKAFIQSLSCNISLSVPGNLTMTNFRTGNTGVDGLFAFPIIGCTLQNRSSALPGVAGAINTGIDVNVGGNIEITTNGSGQMGIFSTAYGGGTEINSFVNIVAGGDIVLNNLASVTNVGGAIIMLGADVSTAANIPNFCGAVSVVAGNQIRSVLNQNPAFVPAVQNIIGYNAIFFNLPAFNPTTHLFISGEDIVFQTLTPRASDAHVIQAPSNIYCAVNTGLDLQGRGIISGMRNNSSTIILARDNIIASFLAPSGVFLGNNPLFANSGNSLEVRAGGDIQMTNSFTSALGTGDIFIEADTAFAEGSLWSNNGSRLTSIAGGSLPTAACGPQGAILLSNTDIPIIYQNPSPESFVDGLGAFRISNTTNNIILTTTNGNITIHSSDTRSDGVTLQDLNLGNIAGADRLGITTTTGNIRIAGSTADSSFNNINILQIPNPWTTGNIYLSANNDLTLFPNGNIFTGGALSDITIRSDNDNSGVGNLTINAGLGIGAVDGSINLYAGYDSLAAGVSSSIIQNDGTIQTVNGPITLLAAHNTTISGNATSITSFSGMITSYAGDDTLITEQILTGGPILMVTGNNMSLEGADITSVSSTVDLVVDNDFPNPPLIGTGAFLMDQNSQINAAGYIRIYTALQGLNVFHPDALLNGFPISSILFGYPGTLYEDSEYEQWCTYFPNGSGGTPFFRIFYKDCLQQVTEQAMLVVDQFLVNLHPYNEFPGWEQKYLLIYSDSLLSEGVRIFMDEPYMLRRRNLNTINHPKSDTVVMPEVE